MAKKTDTRALGKVLRRVRRYWPGLIASLLLATVYVAMSLYIPILIGDAIDCVIDSGKVDFATMSGLLQKVVLCAFAAGISQ